VSVPVTKVEEANAPVQGAASTAPKKKGFMSGGGLVSKGKQAGVRVLPNGEVANTKCYTFGAGDKGALLAQMVRRLLSTPPGPRPAPPRPGGSLVTVWCWWGSDTELPCTYRVVDCIYLRVRVSH
jgi:hypothetical protein